MTISLQFNTGATVTLRETQAKDGHMFLAARPKTETKVSRFGFNVPIAVVGGEKSTLPKSAKVVDDETGAELGTISLIAGMTEGGNAKVTGISGLKVQVGNEEQTLKVERISQPNASTANVLIRTARPGGGKRHEDL